MAKKPAAKSSSPEAKNLAAVLAALTRAVADPAAKPLVKTKTRPGFFDGTANKAGPLVKLALDRGWIEPTGEFFEEGAAKKKTRHALYRVAAAGVAEALRQAPEVELLRAMHTALAGHAEAQAALGTELAELRARLAGVEQVLRALPDLHRQQGELLRRVEQKLVPPNLAELLAPRSSVSSAATEAANAPVASAQLVDADALPAWAMQAVAYVRDHRRRQPYGFCPLPELYHQVAEPLRLTIGQFHDGVRALVKHKRLRLHPFTAAAYQLKEEQYALLAGQEIKYYAEPLAE